MIYIEIITSMIILTLLFTIVYVTIPNQSRLIQESIRQEKAQFSALNMFWKDMLNNELDLSKYTVQSVEYEVEIDGDKYAVTILFQKIDRPNKSK